MRAGGQNTAGEKRQGEALAIWPTLRGVADVLLVEIEKPANETLGAWFSELRNWLDLNHFEPVIFAQAGRRLDRLIYRISFETAAQAQKFSERFAKYSPTTRRATSYERGQLRGTMVGEARAGAAN
jgi:hypothetical protein